MRSARDWDGRRLAPSGSSAARERQQCGDGEAADGAPLQLSAGCRLLVRVASLTMPWPPDSALVLF